MEDGEGTFLSFARFKQAPVILNSLEMSGKKLIWLGYTEFHNEFALTVAVSSLTQKNTPHKNKL